MRKSAVRVPEKVVQRHIVATLRTVGAEVYELGTRRPRGDHQGTCQTPGLSDVIAFLPALPRTCPPEKRVLLFVEAKAAGGRLRPEQVRFRELSLAADIAHVVGDLDAVIAWLIEAGYLKETQVPAYRLRTAPCGAGGH